MSMPKGKGGGKGSRSIGGKRKRDSWNMRQICEIDADPKHAWFVEAQGSTPYIVPKLGKVGEWTAWTRQQNSDDVDSRRPRLQVAYSVISEEMLSQCPLPEMCSQRNGDLLIRVFKVGSDWGTADLLEGGLFLKDCHVFIARFCDETDTVFECEKGCGFEDASEAATLKHEATCTHEKAADQDAEEAVHNPHSKKTLSQLEAKLKKENDKVRSLSRRLEPEVIDLCEV